MQMICIYDCTPGSAPCQAKQKKQEEEKKRRLDLGNPQAEVSRLEKEEEAVAQQRERIETRYVGKCIKKPKTFSMDVNTTRLSTP